MKLPTTTVLLAYINAVERIQRMIERSDSEDQSLTWLQAMENINEAYDRMTEVPYRVVDARMFAYGAGREVHRLFHAVQLLAEWRFLPGTTVTQHDVVVAFNAVGDEGFDDGPIFPDGTTSPAAQREIRTMPIFQNPMGRGRWMVEGFLRDSMQGPTIMITGYGDILVTHIPPNVQFDEAKQIWDIARS